ncbi:N,N-dimethylformamidase beta subunit family domain-containing protein [Sorangium sp. So ce363]|uniref:N,N-dimethylformamidase beta subunit family domain-containing protein n=1 Tax=Sorangium sp. So ce363 TaxID=3133304 RepID=UPI003F63934B
MAIDAYTARKSVMRGEAIGFHVSNTAADPAVQMAIERIGARASLGAPVRFSAGAHATPPDAYAVGCGWPCAHEWLVPPDWPSGVYLATLKNTDGEEASLRFVVRARAPGASILVCIPFFTDEAYNGWGGNRLYPWASPDRSRRVSFERPGGTEAKSALPLVRWLEREQIAVDYCSSMDLHAEPDLLRGVQLLVSTGHDEYWSREMRDAVEAFVRSGGNVAFLSANTCYWQVRIEDHGRTMVCYRDAVEDPLAGIDNDRVTVQWANAPVDRPENHMTGVGYRFGAGNWLDPEAQKEAVYRVNFPEHWVFDGTGLALGDAFGRGSVGYETDAADIVDVDGIARATGLGGTPPTFVVLAVADLRQWRAQGQGGLSTMGIYRRGGTVFTAASVDWAAPFDRGTAPEIERITRNVLEKLSRRYPEHGWQRVGSAPRIVAMTGAEGLLFAATEDGALLWREPSSQNLPWRSAGVARGVVAMACPVEAEAEQPIGIFLVTAEGRLFFRDPLREEVVWRPVGVGPGIVAMATTHFDLFAATSGGLLLTRPTRGGDVPWKPVGRAEGVVAMAAINGKVVSVTGEGRLSWRAPVRHESPWVSIGEAKDVRALAGAQGRLFAATGTGALLARDGF